MYGIRGERRLTEWEVPWLPGYEGSAPVRIGNAAHEQLQLDVFGEVMDALHQARQGGLGAERSRLGSAARIARAPGKDLARAATRASGRCAAAAPAFHPFQGDGLGRLRPRHQERREVRAARAARPLARAPRPRSTTTSARAASTPSSAASCSPTAPSELDASLLLLPAIGFLPPHDPRIVGTVAAIERDLMVDGLVRRYDTAKSADGLPPGEGAFLACSFWLVDAYVLLGRRDDARAAVRAAAVAAQRPRSVERGIRPAHAAGWSAIFRRPSRTWRWSTARAILSHSEKPAEQRSDHPVASKPAMPSSTALSSIDRRARSPKECAPRRAISGQSKGGAPCYSMCEPTSVCRAASRRSSNSTRNTAIRCSLRYMGEPLCYAVAESGELNTFTHVWVYESAADREAKARQDGAGPGLESFPRRKRQGRQHRRAEQLPDGADRVFAADPDAEDSSEGLTARGKRRDRL